MTIIRLREKIKEMEQDLEHKMAVSVSLCTQVHTISVYWSVCSLCRPELTNKRLRL